jgi:RNA polymerase sigma-70 factor (ECF subfamily)
VKKIIQNPGLTKDEMAEFEYNVKTHMQRAYYTALGFLGSHDSAMELSQEAFIRAYRSYKKFDHTKKFFTWYYKILRNLCFNFIRDNKNKTDLSYIENREVDGKSENPVEVVEKRELNKSLELAISKLDFDEREILILKEFEEHSYKEIADLLNIPIGTVMSRLYYARKKLGRILEGMIT